MSHYRFPRNYGLKKDFDVEVKGQNRTCGDSMTVRLVFDQDIIAGISFESKGCVISRAATSLLLEHLKGKKKEVAQF